jgi:hypothetical protein
MRPVQPPKRSCLPTATRARRSSPIIARVLCGPPYGGPWGRHPGESRSGELDGRRSWAGGSESEASARARLVQPECASCRAPRGLGMCWGCAGGCRQTGGSPVTLQYILTCPVHSRQPPHFVPPSYDPNFLVVGSQPKQPDAAQPAQWCALRPSGEAGLVWSGSMRSSCPFRPLLATVLVDSGWLHGKGVRGRRRQCSTVPPRRREPAAGLFSTPRLSRLQPSSCRQAQIVISP